MSWADHPENLTWGEHRALKKPFFDIVALQVHPDITNHLWELVEEGDAAKLDEALATVWLNEADYRLTLEMKGWSDPSG